MTLNANVKFHASRDHVDELFTAEDIHRTNVQHFTMNDDSDYSNAWQSTAQQLPNSVDCEYKLLLLLHSM